MTPHCLAKDVKMALEFHENLARNVQIVPGRRVQAKYSDYGSSAKIGSLCPTMPRLAINMQMYSRLHKMRRQNHTGDFLVALSRLMKSWPRGA
jgi:hypothetical protein